MVSDPLDGMAVFMAVAEARNFRLAGERLGVSASAVSQSLRKLEERVGVPLVHRTTRSVSLSEAGERLYATLRPALQEVEAALAAVGELGSEPRGTLRLLVGTAADPVLTGPVLSDFLVAHPHVRLDLDVSDAVGDIVADGYDAGIQPGEVIHRDMIAVPVTGDIRMTVVGSPAYFAKHPKPRHPRDLAEHECLNWHPAPAAPPYRWEFTDQGRSIVVPVSARVLTTHSAVNIRLACAGLGLAIVYEDQVRQEVREGQLISVLEKFCEPFPGYYLFYPHRRHASPALRAFIEFLQANRSRYAKRRPAGAGSPEKAKASGGR
jgi:DNA-binding transcriptional LysR family regulator